jgi:hypothetical protein
LALDVTAELPDEPLLHRIEALAESCCYAVTVELPNGATGTVTVRVVNGQVGAPEANMIPGWSIDSPSFIATLAAVAAVDEARRSATSSGPRLADVPGGWDVGLGNVVLSAQGRPICVAHGEMAALANGLFQCEGCEARAVLTSA